MKFKKTIYILIIILILILLIGVVFVRGQRAVMGILWGTGRDVKSLVRNIGWCKFENNSWLKNICQTGSKKCDQSTVNFGIYDPGQTFASSTSMAIDHYFINWNEVESTSLQTQIQQTVGNNRWPLFTLEPWVDNQNGFIDKDLLADTFAGKYDQQIINFCSAIENNNQPILLRWGHEMENVTGRYPWAREDGQSYIKAYRHVVDKCRETTDDVYYVWSPVGNKNLDQYWPGRDYVDYVGLSVYSLPEWEINNYSTTLSFEQIFGEKYERVKNYERPIMISEMGVEGDQDRKENWLLEASNKYADYPLLKSVVYFNAVDSPEAWGDEYLVPNWEVSAGWFGCW